MSAQTEDQLLDEVRATLLAEIQRLLNQHMHEQAAALVNAYCMLRAESVR